MRPSVLALVFAACVSAQWLDYPSAGIPRTQDGKPDLTAPAPKKTDGKPNLGGIWHRVPPPNTPSGANFGNTVTYYMPAGSTVPLQPWAAELLQQRRYGNLGAGRPSELCLPHGVLGSMLPNIPFKIIETPGVTLILIEQLAQFRQVFTDGRKLPADMQPAWYGYSIGKWDGDTFIIDSAGFTDKTWLDDSGHPNTEAMRTQERFRRIDFGHMTLDITVDDPKAYTKPWTVTIPLELMPDTELIEDVCDNEKDAAHNKLPK
ncbi:MAG: hypothetical protein ABI811_20900 [Acidobacteriota bacterium]